MKLLITGGSLEAEVQGNPLANVHKLLASISQANEVKINRLKSYIDEVSELKDTKISELYDEFKERTKLEEMEIDELKAMVNSLLKNEESAEGGVLEVEGVKDELRSVSDDTKTMIQKINDRIDRISKEKNEKIKRLQAQLVEINREDGKKIATLKQQLAAIPRVPSTKGKVIDGRKFTGKLQPNVKEKIVRDSISRAGLTSTSNQIGKLNAKPKLPI